MYKTSKETCKRKEPLGAEQRQASGFIPNSPSVGRIASESAGCEISGGRREPEPEGALRSHAV